jgi:transposase
MIAVPLVVGSHSMVAVAGGPSAQVFVTCVDKDLVTGLSEGAIVVMDNLEPQEDVRGRALLEAAAQLHPCSPDLNPIEVAWTEVNRWLRTARRRTRKSIDRDLDNIMRPVTTWDATRKALDTLRNSTPR